MDIAALSMSMSQSSLSQAVGIKVLNMAKDQLAQQSQASLQMIGHSIDPNLGKHLDIRV